jgi:molybdopterin adenylyltransferase
VADIRVAILTASDSCFASKREDTAGAALAALVAERGWTMCAYHVCPDDAEALSTSLIELAEVDAADVVLTCGGTGFGPRDVTPEATAMASERMAPGIAEVIRSESYRVTKRAMLSRGIAGIRATTLIVNLPGSEKAARETFSFIADQLEHAVQMMGGGGHD